MSHGMHWRRKWQPTPLFLAGESQGRRNLVGCRLWGRTESDTTEAMQQQQQQQHGGKLLHIIQLSDYIREFTQVYRTVFWTLWARMG